MPTRHTDLAAPLAASRIAASAVATAPHGLPLSAMVCAVLAALPGLAGAQSNGTTEAATNTLPTVSVRAQPQREPRASITGLGDTPAWQTPVQASSFQAEALTNAQVQRLADVVKLDASTTDAYNTTGYWDYLSVRGFVIDNEHNYLREGLPISAETRIGLENKSGIELLKGTSGLQAGLSAPGGLVNLRVKRPQDRVRQAELAFTGHGSVKAAVDLADRFGQAQQLGLRLNAATERLAPDVQAAKGQRHLLALATDWVLAPGSVIEAEIEHSRHRQPSVPGLSALGNRLPSAQDVDPRTNLNQQTWTQPVDLRGTTGTLRWRQQLASDWKLALSYGEQQLQSDDRAAFPFGCSAENDYTRFCQDGGFDLYDYRSEGERRRTRAWQAQLNGQIDTAGLRHELGFTLMRTLRSTRIHIMPYNWVGTGNVATPALPLPPDTTPSYESASTQEQSTEWQVQDAITLSERWRAWAGLRHTRVSRSSLPTDGSTASGRHENLNTPWLALGYTVAPQMQVYASWGEGAELKRAPVFGGNNPNEILPAVKSRQFELGIKAQTDNTQWGDIQWGLSAFRIQRPEVATVNNTYQLDGSSVHTGLEGYWQAQYGALGLNATAMLLSAERRGSTQIADGMSPTNVPETTLKLSATWRLPPAWVGPLTAQAQIDLLHEGPRWADPANTLRLPAWSRVDASLRAVQHLRDHSDITWRLGVSNLLGTRAWRESPNNFDHIWLFPLAPRTFTASAQIDF